MGSGLYPGPTEDEIVLFYGRMDRNGTLGSQKGNPLNFRTSTGLSWSPILMCGCQEILFLETLTGLIFPYPGYHGIQHK